VGHHSRKLTHGAELRSLHKLLLYPLNLGEYPRQFIGARALSRLGSGSTFERCFGSLFGSPQISQSRNEHRGDKRETDRQNRIDDPAVEAEGFTYR
jgi:hypothetical protein